MRKSLAAAIATVVGSPRAGHCAAGAGERRHRHGVERDRPSAAARRHGDDPVARPLGDDRQRGAVRLAVPCRRGRQDRRGAGGLPSLPSGDAGGDARARRPRRLRARPLLLRGDHGRLARRRRRRRRRRCRSTSSRASDIETAGASETNQIIEALAPSFNFPRPTITDGTDTRPPGHPARPRLGPGAGARQRQAPAHQRAGARQRLDRPRLDRRRPERHPRLGDRAASRSSRDGAAAQYGSDAIAGVINVVPQGRRRRRSTVDLKGGATTHGDGELIDTSLSQGWKLGARLALRHRRVPRPRRDQPRRPGPAAAGLPRSGRAAQPSLGRRRRSKDVMAFFNGSHADRRRRARPRSTPSAASAGARARTAASSAARCRTRTGRRSIPTASCR